MLQGSLVVFVAVRLNTGLSAVFYHLFLGLVHPHRQQGDMGEVGGMGVGYICSSITSWTGWVIVLFGSKRVQRGGGGWCFGGE